MSVRFSKKSNDKISIFQTKNVRRNTSCMHGRSHHACKQRAHTFTHLYVHWIHFNHSFILMSRIFSESCVCMCCACSCRQLDVSVLHVNCKSCKLNGGAFNTHWFRPRGTFYISTKYLTHVVHCLWAIESDCKRFCKPTSKKERNHFFIAILKYSVKQNKNSNRSKTLAWLAYLDENLVEISISSNKKNLVCTFIVQLQKWRLMWITIGYQKNWQILSKKKSLTFEQQKNHSFEMQNTKRFIKNYFPIFP